MDDSYFLVNLRLFLCLSWNLLNGLSFIRHVPGRIGQNKKDRKEFEKEGSQSKIKKAKKYMVQVEENKNTQGLKSYTIGNDCSDQERLY